MMMIAITYPAVRTAIIVVILLILVSNAVLYSKLMKKQRRDSIFYRPSDLPAMLASNEFYIVAFLTILGCFLVFVVGTLDQEQLP